MLPQRQPNPISGNQTRLAATKNTLPTDLAFNDNLSVLRWYSEAVRYNRVWLYKKFAAQISLLLNSFKIGEKVN